MSNLHPIHVLLQPSGAKWYRDGEEAREWLDQFPEDSFSHLEWPAYAWPGGYEIYYYTQDFGVLCHNCANAELNRTIDPDDDQFHVVEQDVDYENSNLVCDHCGRQIAPAYGEE